MNIRPINNLSTAPVPSERTTGPQVVATKSIDPVPGPVETSEAKQEQQAQAVPSEADVRHAANSINAVLQVRSQNLEFSVDSESDRTIIKVVDTDTKEVIRQMPSKEAIEIAKALDRLQSLLIRQTA